MEKCPCFCSPHEASGWQHSRLEDVVGRLVQDHIDGTRVYTEFSTVSSPWINLVFTMFLTKAKTSTILKPISGKPKYQDARCSFVVG